MLKSPTELKTEILLVAEKHMKDRGFIANADKKASETFGLQSGEVSDYLRCAKEIPLDEYFKLFVLTVVTMNDRLAEFFTETEINTYKNQKIEKSDDFPLVFDVVEIANDQWIGRVTVKELMKLRNLHLVNYNANTQRALRRVTINGVEQFKIFINAKAKNAIKESLETRAYIPNTITLNIPEDADYSFKGNKLTINEINHFDIIDGYHRYCAIQELYDLNHDFDYNIELRLVCFTEEKAKRFIWQEDQKTKMRKIDSERMNTSSLSNQLCDRLSGVEPFRNKIGDKGSIIDAALLSRAAHLIYVKQSESFERRDMLLLRDRMVACGKEAEDNDVDLFNREWTCAEIVTFVMATQSENFLSAWKELKAKANEKGYFKTRSFPSSEINKMRR